MTLERRLRQSQKMEAIGNLAGGIAHDFNNILAVISATSEWLEMDATTSDLSDRWHDGIREASNRARYLIGQILLFSRNERSKREAVDLRTVIREAISQVSNIVPSHIIVRHDLQSDRLALANVSQMHQILLNLCTNANHSIGDQLGEITIRLTLESLDTERAAQRPPLNAGDYLLVEVIDTGTGMDEDTLQRIFEPFFSTKPAGKGTGLGLAVVHGIMTSHDGAILAESKLGEGSTFVLYIPAAKPKAFPTSSGLPGPHVPRGHGQKILVVDDEPAVARVACSLINRLGYSAESMNDPQLTRDRLLANPDEFASSLPITLYRVSRVLTWVGPSGLNCPTCRSS